MHKPHTVVAISIFSQILFMSVTCADPLKLTGSYSWEDSCQTVFHSSGSVILGGTVGGIQLGSITSNSNEFRVPGASDGDSYYKLTEHPHKSTPNVTIAVVTGLAEGDSISVSLDVWDESDGASSSYGMWFSEVRKNGQGGFEYAAGVDSSYFDTEYAPGVVGKWSTAKAEFEHIRKRELKNEGIGIQVRLSSSPSTSDDSTDYFIDNLYVSVSTTSSNAIIHFPNGITHVIQPDKTKYNENIR